MSEDIQAAAQAGSQALRLQRHRMAAATSVLVILILLAAHLLGVLPLPALIVSASAIAMFTIGFYLIFLSGLNRRFRDPSMTLAQMLAATLVILGTMYAAESATQIFLLVLLMVFMFGVLRFDTLDGRLHQGIAGPIASAQ